MFVLMKNVSHPILTHSSNKTVTPEILSCLPGKTLHSTPGMLKMMMMMLMKKKETSMRTTEIASFY